MFTGIVEELGKVKSFNQSENLVTLKVSCPTVANGTKLGDSVCLNGVCLTVVSKEKTTLTFELMLETIRNSNLSKLEIGSAVNLERALKADSRFGGHFVTGHIDAMGQIQSMEKKKNFVEWMVTLDRRLIKLIVPKGSVTVDGVSLTVGKTARNTFSIYLIPYTLKVTTLGQRQAGDFVNVETDLIAKYVLTGKKQ